jgi:hypothetical protein
VSEVEFLFLLLKIGSTIQLTEIEIGWLLLLYTGQ